MESDCEGAHTARYAQHAYAATILLSEQNIFFIFYLYTFCISLSRRLITAAALQHRLCARGVVCACVVCERD